jgi:hypothetical protein
MLNRLAVTLAALFVAAGPAGAQSAGYFISCEIRGTHDFTKGTTEGTTGSDVFRVSPQPDGSTAYSLPFACASGTLEFNASDTQLWFRCDQELGGITLDHFAVIDRITGDYQRGYGKKGQNGLLHFGSCRRADQMF